MATPLVSVVVCTYNRSRSLQETLGALRAQRAAGFDYEVVVVDNNSTDDTRPVAAALQTQWDGRLRYVFEGRQGISHARNTGVEAARGDVVAFTDDDVRATPDWLRALRRAFQERGADCVFGKILPIWEAPRPAWLSGAHFMSRLALLDYGDEPFLARHEDQQFYGANFAVRRAVLKAMGDFNPALGHRGTEIGGGEDTELFLKLLESKRVVAYEPRAVVHHVVPADRLQKRFFRRREFDQGRVWARTGRGAGRWRVAGIPLRTVRACALTLRDYLASLLAGRREARRALGIRLWFYIGFFSEHLGRIAHLRPAPPSRPEAA